MSGASPTPWANVAPERRRIMQAVRSKNTKPEIALRSLLHREGYRFRLHYKGLPGTPDLVFPSRQKAVEVRGCFWHGHSGCARAKLPMTRRDYWLPKLAANRARDVANEQALNETGWRLLVVWECELRHPDHVLTQMRSFLGDPRPLLPASNRAPRSRKSGFGKGESNGTS